MSIPIPRFTGRSYEENGKWKWEFCISMLGDEGGDMYGSRHSYDTKEKAIRALKLAIQDAINLLAKDFPELGINAGQYIDMKTNQTRRWDGRDEH